MAIDTDYIKLDSFLKLANLVMSGGEAKIVIQEGQIRVNGEVETRRGRKLYPGDQIALDNHPVFVVERA
ncbi:S4 domain-containing protein YaaA [Trichlorobacter sp.]|uniref:S4 domain-containing protein YaaA n=1 Tax=Trichlorobacter sp. TaxID=2911007 RepID=UPI0039C9B4D8